MAGRSYPGDTTALRTRGASLRRLVTVTDARGSLTAGQVGEQLPFVPKRVFFVYQVPPGRTRGGHGHRDLHEFIICQRGRCTVVLDDGANRDEVLLNRPDVGLHVPPLTWTTLREFSADALLVVAASEVYRPEDYIHDYQEFLGLAAAQADRPS